jgi:sigma-B regulation protein RsbU (phosphoserine phosphatase)
MKKEIYKILIADDSPSTFKFITEIIGALDLKVELISASNGKEACEKAFRIIPDLILMDVIMPEMNGIEAVKSIRSNFITQGIPIIVFSASESLDSAYESGANDFISKPIKKFEVLIKIRSALNLVQKIEEIKIQKEQLELKNQEIIEHHNKITQQRNDIIEDIRHSKRFQKAIFPSDKYMKEILNDYFILNLPKSIVSGDFYWIGENEAGKIIAVADCSGHGISGAFMTMVGTAFLNDILLMKSAVNANDILFQLREMVMRLLKQQGEEADASDGMDISMIILNKEKNRIQFCGANNPMYLIRQGELKVYKGDRMPIGIHLNFNLPFTNQIIDLQKGDLLYLFTDGYADQFGGVHNKKLRYNQFQDILLDIYKKPLNEQNKDLTRTLDLWRGSNEQVDDILILGFKI